MLSPVFSESLLKKAGDIVGDNVVYWVVATRLSALDEGFVFTGGNGRPAHLSRGTPSYDASQSVFRARLTIGWGFCQKPNTTASPRHV